MMQGLWRQWPAILVGWLATWLVLAVIAWWLASWALLFAQTHTGVPFSAVVRDFLVAGAVSAVGLVLLSWALERLSLYLHGYRQPTDREWAVLDGTMQAVAPQMGVSRLPEIRVLDLPVPAAWTFQRTIAVTSQLAALDQRALAGILAHELAHYRDGDAVALRLAWATGWPLVLLFNLWLALQGHQLVREPQVQAGPGGMLVGQAQRLTTQGVQIIGAGAAGCGGMLAGLLFVLSWLVVRLLLLPLMGWRSREGEYAADDAAADAGYGPGLALALQQLGVFELSPMQWHAVLAARHPPIQLRIDRLSR